VAVLLPSLAAVKFPWSKVFSGLGWKPSPEVKALLITSVPVFISAGVLQIGVLLDRLIAVLLSSAGEFTTLSFLGQSIAYPMAEGAAARLNLAQYLYQFPLGVFAVAISTAIFPALSRQALEPDKTAFAATLRQGILASLVIGLPASAGMMLVAQPTIELLFSSKNFSAQDVLLTAQSCIIYSAAIWAFSVQNILNRAFYALGDNRTPLYWAAGNLLINLVVELPLIFTPLAESGMAVGTLVSFVVQSLFMGWQLSRRLKSQTPGSGLGLHQIIRPALLMLAAALLMSGVCLGFMQLPIYPTGNSRPELLLQLIMIMSAGGLSYFAACQLLGLPVLKYIRRKGN
jgi:putative peptidoglycan lipid II flippase